MGCVIGKNSVKDYSIISDFFLESASFGVVVVSKKYLNKESEMVQNKASP